jgi:hypothetical protein
VVLTECHSVPMAGALEAALRAHDHGLDLACCESQAPVLTAAAHLEDTMYQDLFERHVDAGDPRAISLRAVALSKELYLRCGGQRPEDHECFAERVLSARLMRAGAHIGRASGAVVEQLPNTSFRRLRQDNLNYHRDEIRVRLAGARSDVDPDLHLETPPEWESRARFDKRLHRAALRGVLRMAAGWSAPCRMVWAALPRIVVHALFGARPAALGARMRLMISALRFAARWRLGRASAAAPVWQDVARASVLRVFSEPSARQLHPGPRELARDGGPLCVDALAGSVSGLHGPEELRGQHFRWTEPVVILNVRGGGTLLLRLAVPRALSPGQIAAVYGSHRIDVSVIDADGDSITIQIPAE